MASPQPTDSHTRISNELYTQILMRDFTKRQRAILDLIIRLSYGCGKKTALIAQTKVFTLCGIQHNKVRKELNALRKINVIDWDEPEGRYWINKDYDVWDIEPPAEGFEQYFAEVLHVNINDQKGHDQNGHDQKGQQDMTKKVNESCPKKSIELLEIVDVARPEEVSITKDNYKEIEKIKDLKIKDINTQDIKESREMNVKRKVAEFFPYGVAPMVMHDIEKYMTEIEDLELLSIVCETAKKGVNVNAPDKLVVATLRRFLNSGITTIAAYEQREVRRQVAASKQGRNMNVRKPSSGSSTETDEEWEAMERNYFARSKDPL